MGINSPAKILLKKFMFYAKIRQMGGFYDQKINSKEKTYIFIKYLSILCYIIIQISCYFEINQILWSIQSPTNSMEFTRIYRTHQKFNISKL